jgi:hypothetical protein
MNINQGGVEWVCQGINCSVRILIIYMGFVVFDAIWNNSKRSQKSSMNGGFFHTNLPRDMLNNLKWNETWFKVIFMMLELSK